MYFSPLLLCAVVVGRLWEPLGREVRLAEAPLQPSNL